MYTLFVPSVFYNTLALLSFLNSSLWWRIRNHNLITIRQCLMSVNCQWGRWVLLLLEWIKDATLPPSTLDIFLSTKVSCRSSTRPYEPPAYLSLSCRVSSRPNYRCSAMPLRRIDVCNFKSYRLVMENPRNTLLIIWLRSVQGWANHRSFRNLHKCYWPKWRREI